MASPLVLPDLHDLVQRYQAGVSLKQLAGERGVSRPALGRALALAGVTLRGRSDAERLKWQAIKITPGGIERQLASAWRAADARNADTERKVLSMYRSGLTSQRAIAAKVGLQYAAVGGILRKHGIAWDRHGERRANGLVGGFNHASQCQIEPELAAILDQRGLDHIHQCAIGTRNVDFGFAAERVAVEIVRRHWNDAKSLRRQRLEQIFGAGWRLFVIYDPMQRGIDLPKCADHLVAFLEFVRSHPATPGQYWVVSGDGEIMPESRPRIHHFTRVPGL